MKIIGCFRAEPPAANVYTPDLLSYFFVFTLIRSMYECIGRLTPRTKQTNWAGRFSSLSLYAKCSQLTSCSNEGKELVHES